MSERLRFVDLRMTYEHDVSECELSDLVARLEQSVGESMIAIEDAECDFVAIVPKSKASAIVELLNWAAENYPFEARD